MRHVFFRIVILIVFCGTHNIQAQEKKQKKEKVMATIICECLENEGADTLSQNFNEKLKDCYNASVLGALINEIPTDKDSDITINSDGSSDEITEKDNKKAFELLEKDCEVYKNYFAQNQLYQGYLEKSATVACECVEEIPTSIATEEKNNLIRECVEKGSTTTKAMERLSLTSVESIRAFHSEVERILVSDCNALKKVTFSNDEEKLYSYSTSKKATEFYNKGINESEKGNYKKAIGYYKKAVDIDEKFVFAWDNLGRAYRELHNYDKAIEAYKKSIAIDSLNPTPLMNIAVAYGYKEDFESSVFWYNKLIEANPKDPEGQYGLSIAYMSLNKLEASLNSIIKAYELYKESKSPYEADAKKVMRYLYKIFEEQNKKELFEKVCEEHNIKLN